MFSHLFRRRFHRDAEESGVRRTPVRIAVSLDRDLLYRSGVTTRVFTRLLRRAGGRMVPVFFSPGEPHELEELACRILQGVDGLLLSGGIDVDPTLYGGERDGALLKPERDRFELALLREASRLAMPVLGICRGCQLINVHHGGTLRSLRQEPALKKFHGPFRAHPVRILATSRLAEILGAESLRWVRSIHGQAVGRVGQGLRVAAVAPDDVPEAIESDDHLVSRQWILGVQWHPEFAWRQRDEHVLIDAFVEAAAKDRLASPHSF